MIDQKSKSYFPIAITSLLFYVFIFSGCLFGIPYLYKAPKDSNFKYYGKTPVIDSLSSLNSNGVYVCSSHYENTHLKIFYEFRRDGKLNIYGHFLPDEPNLGVVNRINLEKPEPDYFGYFFTKGDSIFLEYVFPQKMVASNVWYQSFGKVNLSRDSIKIFRIEVKEKNGWKDIKEDQSCYFIKF